MATSIAKRSKSFFVKVLVGVITLPFIYGLIDEEGTGSQHNLH